MKPFHELCEHDKEVYIRALKDTAEFFRWIGEDLEEAAEELDSLAEWFWHSKEQIHLGRENG